MTFETLLAGLATGSFTAEQLAAFTNVLRSKRVMVGNSIRATLNPGQKVSFDSSKFGRTVTGTVVKIKPKNILIDCGADGKWNVPATMVRISA